MINSWTLPLFAATGDLFIAQIARKMCSVGPPAEAKRDSNGDFYCYMYFSHPRV